MSQMATGRWKSKFARFVQSYGVALLAAELDVRPSAIYHWMASRRAPRPSHAEIIQRLASERGVRLTLDHIYQHSRELRVCEPVSRLQSFSANRTPATGFAHASAK